jgi:hypothetical protein
MIINLNQSNYIDNNGLKYDDRINRQFASEKINTYFNDECTINICDRYNDDDMVIQYQGYTFNCDVKSCKIPFNTKMWIGYNADQYRKDIVSGKKVIRIIMIYKDAIAMYDILKPDFKENFFWRWVNDQVYGYCHREFVQLNNANPTLVINYCNPILKDVS